MRKGILKSGAIYGIANVLSAGVPFLLLPILTRALSPVQYGEVVSFFILVTVCASVAGLSLQAAVGVCWLDTSQAEPRRYTASALLLVFGSTATAAFLAASFAPHLGFHARPMVCALAAVVAGANVIQSIRFAVWQSCEKPLLAATLQVASACLNITLSLLAVFLLHLGGIGRILGAAISAVLIAGSSIYLLFRDQSATQPSSTDMLALLRFGLPLIPHALAGAFLVNADTLAVSAKFGPGVLGIYGTACQLGMIINVIADAALKAYTPTMYRLLVKNTTRSRLRVVAISYLSLPIWILVAVALWGGLITIGSLLLGSRYIAAIDLAIWFLLGGAMTGVYLNIAGLFFFSGKTEWLSIATLTGAGFALVMAPFAVSTFGVVGGGVLYLTAQFIVLVAAWGLSNRIKPMPWGRPLLALRVLFRTRSEA